MTAQAVILKAIAKAHTNQLKRGCESVGNHNWRYHKVNLKTVEYYILKKTLTKIKKLTHEKN